TIASLHQGRLGITAVCAVERNQRGQFARRCDLKYCACAIGAAIARGAVKIAIRALHQALRRSAICTVEREQRGQCAVCRDLKDRAFATKLLAIIPQPATVCCAVETGVAALHQAAGRIRAVWAAEKDKRGQNTIRRDPKYRAVASAYIPIKTRPAVVR